MINICNLNLYGECSEFSDIFDLEHFKKVLGNDVRIVSSLPSTHITTRPVVESRTPLHVSPQWIRARYLKRVRIVTQFVIPEQLLGFLHWVLFAQNAF